MDPFSLAAIAAPFLAKGAEAFSKSAGDKLGEKASELCQAVIDKFKGDSDAEETLALAQKRPDSKGQQSALEEILAENLKDDQDFAAKVQRLVDELQKGGGSKTTFDQRGQTVHGSQTNIAGNVSRNVISETVSGPAAASGNAVHRRAVNPGSIVDQWRKTAEVPRDAVDLRGATGTIYKPTGPVNQQIGDRHYYKAGDRSNSSESAKGIKALFLAANPKGTQPLQLDEEVREITAKIRASEYRDSIDLVSAWAVRPDDLLQLLNQHKPQIVHFSGHGSEKGEIILVDDQGRSKSVSPAALKALFSTLKDNIRLVILNACYSRIQAEAITQMIDCVIGMNEEIGDKAAITFAASFYRAIGFGRSVKEAFDQGVVALMLEGIPEENKPQLLTREGVDPEKVFFYH